MLKINKILSRKIKSHLSLRGAFPHVIARERNDRSNLNNSGFSLIELMVAAVILSLAIFGIFQAYSTGFLGMFDARDRTVATNYAREAMEDVKNMDFLEISPVARTQIEGTKFEREISVDYNVEGSSNLTRVTVRVFWENRKGQMLNIATSMLVNNIEFTAGEAAKILLYVYPYNVILPEEDNTELIAVVKDVKGNTITSWDEDITFTIILGTDLGYLETLGQTSVTKSPVNGRATVIFYSSAEALGGDEKGFVNIRAEVLTNPELGFDTVEVTLTWGAVSIALVPEQDTIKINESTTIHAYLKNAAGGNVTVAEAEITFDFSGEGTLPTPLTRETSGGEVPIILTATNTPGIATVTASASNLLSDSVDIYITGPPKYIYVEVNPNYIYTDQTAEVTAILKDINGITVNAEDTVNIDLSLTLDSVGQGTFTAPSTISIGIGSSSGYSTFTPTPTGTGNATVQAVDPDGVLTTGEAAIFIADPLVADYIEVTADHSSIEVGGDIISTITAVIKNPDGITVFNYIQPITFSTNKGSFSEIDPNDKDATFIIDDDNYQDGEATLVLYANNETESGIATITVTSDDLTPGSTEVGFYVEADHIILSSDLVSINTFGKVEDTCTITATIKDSTGTTVENYIGTVTFSIVPPGSNFGQFALVGSTIVTVIAGQASIDLRSKCDIGTVVVKATSTFGENEITSIDPHLSVGVTDGGTRDIELVAESVDLAINKKGVGFDILVSGGNLRIYNMQITCDPSAKLTEIEIDGETVYMGSINDGNIVDIDPTILSTAGTGEYNIYFTYIAGVGNLDFDIIFNAQPDCGLNIIDFSTP